MINGRGLIYTVEEVSDLLGIPRPTLYRYLREYSIPHLRVSGKISIPEQSFDRIRKARDLHKEGLGTESVRRALRESDDGPDTGEIKERIERISESLDKLKGNGSAADEALSSQAMRTVLARQSLMMSAMFNLTGMVEELLLASGKPRKVVFEEVDGEIREVTPLSSRTVHPRTGRAVPARTSPSRKGLPAALTATRPDGFGSLARRRRTSLAVLATLLVAAILLLVLPTLGAGFPFADDRADESATSEKVSEEAARTPSGSGEAPEDVASGTRDREGAGELPDVSGKSVVEAARVLSSAGHEVAAIRTVKSAEEAGTVVRVEPAGSGSGAPVVLVMSGGPSGTETGSS